MELYLSRIQILFHQNNLKMARDQFTRAWITDNAVTICPRYANGVLTLRGLHYQLVALGMTNSIQQNSNFTLWVILYWAIV